MYFNDCRFYLSMLMDAIAYTENPGIFSVDFGVLSKLVDK